MKARSLSARHVISLGLADLAGSAKGLLYAGPVRFLARWAYVITHLGLPFLALYLCSLMVDWCRRRVEGAASGRSSPLSLSRAPFADGEPYRP